MSFFNSPNDMQWASTLEPIHRSHSQTFVAEILDAKGDGNFNDALMQEWSIRVVGWGTEVYNCRGLVQHAGYNGSGTYSSYKKGDVVVVQAREGQMDDLMIIGSIRLNGDKDKLNQEGDALKYGDMPIGASNQPAPANQVSIHPTRLTKLDGYTQIYGSNNLIDTYLDPAIAINLEDQQSKQPIPGVVETVNREGVKTTYAHGGIIQYTDGNLVFVSGGSKENVCTKFLSLAKRHQAIATQLKELAIFQPGTATDNFLAGIVENEADQPAEDADTPINSSESLDIDLESPLVNTDGTPATPPFVENSRVSTEQAQPQTEITEDPLTEDNINNKPNTLAIANRIKEHEKLSKLALEQAEECNRNTSAFQQQAGLMSQSNGSAFGVDSSPNPAIPSKEPSQFFGNVAANNYSSRNGGFPKPPVTIVPAHPNNYRNQQQIPNKIFLHNTAVGLQSTLNTFQDPKREASAHYTIARDGKVYQHVPDNLRAYHSTNGNDNSIGIEHVATDTEKGFTPQMEASSIALIKYLVSTYNIDTTRIAGHRTVYDTRCPDLIWPTEPELKQWVKDNIKV